MEVKGYTGTVVFDGHSVTIIRKGLGRVVLGKGQLTIPVASITAVRWKPADALVNGYIHFSIASSPDRRTRTGRQTRDLGHDENSVIFHRRQMPEFEQLRDAVEAAMQGPGQKPALAASIPEQIAQLAALRDQGILTEAEFTEQKTKLLAQL